MTLLIGIIITINTIITIFTTLITIIIACMKYWNEGENKNA